MEFINNYIQFINFYLIQIILNEQKLVLIKSQNEYLGKKSWKKVVHNKKKNKKVSQQWK